MQKFLKNIFGFLWNVNKKARKKYISAIQNTVHFLHIEDKSTSDIGLTISDGFLFRKVHNI